METANKTYVLMNEKELNNWIQCRLDGGIKYAVEKQTLGGLSRTTKLTDVYGKEFCLDWKLVGRTEYVESLLPQVKKILTQTLGVLADVYGCEGFFLGVKIPHVTAANELEMGYGLYVENIEPEDFLSLQFNYQGLMDETMKPDEMLKKEIFIIDLP